MSAESDFFSDTQTTALLEVTSILRSGREEILRDWIERIRDNTTVQTEEELSEPLLLDHMPQLYDAIVDRLDLRRSRGDTEQLAAIHGFARRLSGYNVAETVLELLMFRRAIWVHLTAVGVRVEGGYAAMEIIDGMVDRAILASLQAFLDPNARMLGRPGADGDA